MGKRIKEINAEHQLIEELLQKNKIVSNAKMKIEATSEHMSMNSKGNYKGLEEEDESSPYIL